MSGGSHSDRQARPHFVCVGHSRTAEEKLSLRYVTLYQAMNPNVYMLTAYWFLTVALYSLTTSLQQDQT